MYRGLKVGLGEILGKLSPGLFRVSQHARSEKEKLYDIHTEVSHLMHNLLTRSDIGNDLRDALGKLKDPMFNLGRPLMFPNEVLGNDEATELIRQLEEAVGNLPTNCLKQ